jgi:predicted ATPase/DNA-binding CsgD family transcriptional regulator
VQAVLQQRIHKLPLAVTPFVGRKKELAELADLLTDPACRLLTLFGPGGIGKTRLALEVAMVHQEDFLDGVYFVPLEDLSSSDFITCAIAEALDYSIHEAGESMRQILNHLRFKNILLVLDNFEHLLDGVGIVADILTAAPGVKILATSREALNLQEEFLWPVAGMSYPLPDDLNSGDLRLEEYSAIQLFIQHARRVRSDFPFETERDGVIQLCTLVEGMPLALELASARVRVLSCEEIAHEIARNLDFLKTQARNVPPRHQSMRAVLDHSWNLLSVEEQSVLRRLSVFRGGFTRDAAAIVGEAALPVLMALVDKSLLRWNAADHYSLHELVRQYAEKQLKDVPDDFGSTRERHSAYFLTFLSQQWEPLLGSHPKEALNAIEIEIDNIRTAWGWAVVQGMEAEIDSGLDSLWFFYDTRGWYREGSKVFALATESLKTEHPEIDGSLLLGRLMARQGVLCNSIQWCSTSRSMLETALAIFRRLDARAEIAFALLRLGEVMDNEESDELAYPYFQESYVLYEELGDRWGAAYALNWLANVNPEAETRHQQRERCLALYHELDSQWGLAIAIPTVGFSALSHGQYQEAMRLGQEGLERCQEIGIRWGSAMSLQVMGYAAQAQGDYQVALRYFLRSLEESLDLKLERFLLYAAYGAARALTALGDLERAFAFDTVAYHFFTILPGQFFGIQFEHDLSADRFEEIRERSKTIEPKPILERLLNELAATLSGLAISEVSQSATDLLTEREVEILQRVSVGMSNRDIAEALFLSTGTVKWYLSQIYSKLGVNSRTQAVARAREMQLISQ